MVWSPAAGEDSQVEFKGLDGLRKLHPEYEAHSVYLAGYEGQVFRSSELKNFQLIQPLAPAVADTLPAVIQQLLGWPKRETRIPGAYPEAVGLTGR